MPSVSRCAVNDLSFTPPDADKLPASVSTCPRNAISLSLQPTPLGYFCDDRGLRLEVAYLGEPLSGFSRGVVIAACRQFEFFSGVHVQVIAFQTRSRAREPGGECYWGVDLSQLWQESLQVAGCHFCLGDCARELERLRVEFSIGEKIFCLEGVGGEMTVGQGNVEVSKKGTVLVGNQVERKAFEFQPRLLGK